MWKHCFHLLKQDNMTAAKALWTSKSTFISMTLNSLPIKDKSPFHTLSSICQCHHTKEGGNLFMPNMPPISTFGCPFEHCFSIKVAPFLFQTQMSLWFHSLQLEIAMITYLSIRVLLWLPSHCHSTLLLLRTPSTSKVGKWHMDVHRNGSDFHPSHTGRGSGF